MESCSSFGTQKGECSKHIFQILVYYYYKMFYTSILNYSTILLKSKQWF